MEDDFINDEDDVNDVSAKPSSTYDVDNAFKLKISCLTQGSIEEKEGEVYFLEDNRLLGMKFQLVLNDEPKIKIVYWDINKDPVKRPQTLNCAYSELNYGPRLYFICQCGKRCGKLYLRPAVPYFACRECLNLEYYLTTLNRKASCNELAYQLNRRLKLQDEEMAIKRLFYKDKPTKRVMSYLKKTKKLNMDCNPEIKARINQWVGR